MISFDQAAAMTPSPEMMDFLQCAGPELFYNQEALHGGAYLLREKLRSAGESLCRKLYPYEEAECIFASSGTELVNLLCASPVVAQKKVYTDALEHPAVPAALRRNQSETWDLPVSANGEILPDFPRKGNVLFIHHVQSETGRVQNAEALAAEFRKSSPDGAVIADTIQSAGKLPLVRGADVLLVSGHKFGALGGAAAILPKSSPFRQKIKEFAQKARSELHLISRVEVLPVLSMSYAAGQNNNIDTIREINRFLRRELAGDAEFTLPEEMSSPYILHFTVPGKESAVVLRMLSENGIYAGSGSACSAESREPSAVLTAMGMPKKKAFSAFRLSFGFQNRLSEAKKFMEVWQEVLKNY